MTIISPLIMDLDNCICGCDVNINEDQFFYLLWLMAKKRKPQKPCIINYL